MYPPQGMIGLSVTAGIEPVAGGLSPTTRGSGDAAQVRPGRLAAQPPGVIPGRDEQQRRRARAEPVYGCRPGMGGHQRDYLAVQVLELAAGQPRRPSSRSATRTA